MQTHRIKVTMIAASLGLLLLQCGCSLIGLGIGSLVDSGKPKEKSVEIWQLVNVKRGTQVRIVTNGGQVVSGEFCGATLMTRDAFRDAYIQARRDNPDCRDLPAIGDTVALFGRGGMKVEGELVGAELSSHEEGWDYFVQVRQLRDDETRFCNLSDVVEIRKPSGDRMTATRFQELISLFGSKTLSAVTLCEAGVPHELALDTVSFVNVPTKRSAATTGFLIGAVVDATIIVIAVAASQHDDPPPSPPSSDSTITGCPFFYSYDGSGYTLDAEPLGAVVCQAMQKSDLVLLQHLQESEGQYRIRVTSELAETEVLDEVRLLAVDCPDSIEVIPSSNGSLHTFTSSNYPIRAYNYCGADILRQVKARDDECWISNPFGRDPHAADQLRDGVELEFTKPASAKRVKLAVCSQNTKWGAEKLNGVIKLLGSEADNWYTQLAASPLAKTALEQAMIREGMLTIKLWNGVSWTDAGFIWAVGPRLEKTESVELDISKIQGERLKIRLESTAGFWMINNVMVDYSADRQLQVTELSAVAATDYQGHDLQTLLAKSDNKYYVMPTNADRADIVFDAPPLEPGMTRTLILKCSGYYNIHIPANSEPHLTLMAQLISQPGAFGHWALDALEREVPEMFMVNKKMLARSSD